MSPSLIQYHLAVTHIYDQITRHASKSGVYGSPIDPNMKLGTEEEYVVVDRDVFHCLVGRLINLSHKRPDIVDAVSVIRQFMHCPKEVHLHAAHWVLYYLKGTPRKGILFKRNGGLVLEAYTDLITFDH